MKQLPYFLLMLVLVFLSPSFAVGADRALLVGINNYEHLPANTPLGVFPNLRGSETDVRFMEQALLKDRNFSPAGIKKLIGQDATKQNMVKVFKEWLIQGTAAGDTALFYFSGHGTRVPTANPNKADGWDRALCPYDMDPQGGKNILLDDELASLLRELRERDVVVILDACYAGGMKRSARGKTASLLYETGTWTSRYLPVVDYKPSPPTYSAKGVADEPLRALFLSAARKDQVAVEMNIEGQFRGAFTYGLVDALHSRDATYQEVHEHTTKVVRDVLELPQEPQISPEDAKIVSKTVFGIREKPPEQGTSVSVCEEVKLKVRVEPFGSPGEMKLLQKRLEELSFVQLVKEADFDRLIRGEFKNGQYHATLFNRLGDRFAIPPAKDFDVIVEAVAAQAEYGYMLKQLGCLRNPEPAFKVRLEPRADKERRDYFLGEEITFSLTSERDGYLLLIGLDGEGNFHLLFPNQHHQDNAIQAKKQYSIPDEKMRQRAFYFEFGPPAGLEVVKAIVTTSRVPLEKLGLENFQQHFDGLGRISVPRGKRAIFVRGVQGIAHADASAWSEDVLVLRSHERGKE